MFAGAKISVRGANDDTFTKNGNVSTSNKVTWPGHRKKARYLIYFSLYIYVYASLYVLNGLHKTSYPPKATMLAGWLEWLVGSGPIIASTTTTSWHQYVRSPENRIVYPVAVLGDYTVGDVRNPEGLLSGGKTTFTREPMPEMPVWPSGIVASASSWHAAGRHGRLWRTYGAGNAVDGDVESFWNDDTPGVYPDVLTILMPNQMTVKLEGVTVLSNRDGVPVDFKVEVLVGSNGSWVVGGEVWGNERVWIRVPFEEAVSVRGVRIVVTRAQPSDLGEYTRINEVWPGLVDDPALSPSVVVDFGKPVVGFLSISFAGASENRPGIRLAFAEMLEYLTDVSDFSRSYNVSQPRPIFLNGGC